MATFSKQKLSGSTDGRMIDITATATPGTLIHTAHATDEDEIILYAVNNSGGTTTLTLEYGGVTAADLIEIDFTKDKNGLRVVLPGGFLTNSLVLRAFCDVASDIKIYGWVNRITP